MKPTKTIEKAILLLFLLLLSLSQSIAQTVEVMAHNEQLNAHENAMALRRLEVQDENA